MTNWRNRLLKFGHDADTQFDRLRMKLRERLGSNRPVIIQPYHWYGTRQQLTVRGRLLNDKGLRKATDNDAIWDNLLNTYRRFESDELPFTPLSAEIKGTKKEMLTDDEGYFRTSLPIEGGDDPPTWYDVQLQTDGPEGETVEATAKVLVPPPSAQFGVISDIDDTILQTFATNLIKVARLTFLSNARMRLPFPGVAALYRALQAGSSGDEQNPLFYVSSSPWNLYDLLVDFMALQGIPAGPLCLRDLGIDENKFISSGHGTHKKAQISAILDTYPNLPFILSGDSGQHDPEIYRDICHAYPGRILAVYIRDVSDDKRDQEVVDIANELDEQGFEMLFAQDSLAVALHAAALGLIAPDAVSTVAAAVKEEQQVDDADDLLDA